MSNSSLLLCGLDGSNPLAFLAALGTLRILSLALPGERVKMSWNLDSGAWRPILHLATAVSQDQFLEELFRYLQSSSSQRVEFSLGKNLTVEPAIWLMAARTACRLALGGERNSADFIAAFGCEMNAREVNKSLRIATTEFYFIFGSGHQHFLETASKLLTVVTQEHLREALFGPWHYKDAKLGFRWDPRDAKEYAYQWRAPADEGTTTVWGANRLAFEAIPCFPVFPVGLQCHTTAFPRNGLVASFAWPLWKSQLSLDVCRSLLARPKTIRDLQIAPHSEIAAIFQCEKRKIGEGANFKWAFTPGSSI